MKVTVDRQTRETKATVTQQDKKEVVAVGVQGPAGPAGPAGLNLISTAADIDASNKQNGSILVYKTITNKWTSTTVLDSQNMEGGEY